MIYESFMSTLERISLSDDHIVVPETPTANLEADNELIEAVNEIFTPEDEAAIVEAKPKPKYLKIREDAIRPGEWRRRLEAEQAALAAELGDDESDIEDEPSRFKKIRSGLGKLATHVMIAQMQVTEKIGTFLHRNKEIDDNDEPLTRRDRIRRKLGVFAAGATLATMAATSAYLMHKNGMSAMGSHNTALSEPFLPNGSHNIVIGGNNDGSGAITTHMIDTWTGKPGQYSVIDYPAGIAPKDPTTFNESTSVGVDHLHNAITSTPGDKTVFSYSQGTVPAGEELSRLAEQNGGKLPDDIRGVFVATPKTPNTGLNETFGQYFSGPMKMFGIDSDAGKMPLGDHTTIIGARGDAISNMPDLAKNPLGAADAAVGYLTPGGRHWYGDLDPSQLQTRVGDDGTTYVTVLPKSGIDSPTLELAQKNGFLVTPQAERFADAIAPQVDTGGAQPNLDPNKILKTGSDLLEDSINRALPADAPKINIPMPDLNIPTPAAPVDPAPVIDAAPIPAPASIIPAPIMDAAPAPVQEAVQQWTPPVQNFAPQINDTIDQAANQVANAVGGNNTPAGKAVNDIASQAQGILGGFLPH